MPSNAYILKKERNKEKPLLTQTYNASTYLFIDLDSKSDHSIIE